MIFFNRIFIVNCLPILGSSKFLEKILNLWSDRSDRIDTAGPASETTRGHSEATDGGRTTLGGSPVVIDHRSVSRGPLYALEPTITIDRSEFRQVSHVPLLTRSAGFAPRPDLGGVNDQGRGRVDSGKAVGAPSSCPCSANRSRQLRERGGSNGSSGREFLGTRMILRSSP
jgi:hypothetical protein